MLGHRLRRWPNIKASLSQYVVFAGMLIHVLLLLTSICDNPDGHILILK